MPSQIGLGVSVGFGGDFAREGAIDIGEVNGCEGHADDPPNEADFEAIVGGFGVVDGKRVDGIARRKNHRINAKDDAGEHPEQVHAGREKSIAFVLAAEFKGNASESGNGEKREDVAERPGFEIGGDLRLDAEG